MNAVLARVVAFGLFAFVGGLPLPGVAGAATTDRGAIDWRPSPRQVERRCTRAIDRARSRIHAVTRRADRVRGFDDGLGTIEDAVAELDDALVAEKVLGDVATDEAVRTASAQCNERLGAWRAEIAADPAIHALAKSVAAASTDAAQRQLARAYLDAGRRAGVELDAAARAELAAQLARLDALQIAYQQALGEDRSRIHLSAAEASELPPSSAASPSADGDGVDVAVDLRTHDAFLRSVASADARRRFVDAFYRRGGPANVQRLVDAIAQRRAIATRLGYADWASYQLAARMAGTPDRARRLLLDIDRALLPKARDELATLLDLKARSGDASPLTASDMLYYQAQLERERYALDNEAVRAWFPADHVVPAVMAVFEELLSITFRRVTPSRPWADGVQQYAIADRASGRTLGFFLLDLEPRDGKFTRPASFPLRAGHRLRGGGYRLPISSIIGNGPAATPGKPALYAHRDLVELFHEFGHLVHSTLSTAPYATLYGANVRTDFVEAPSQMLENWMWQPAVLRRVSRHVDTGEPLPDATIARMIALRHAADGLFWTRQAFLGAWDLALHGSDAVDPVALWFDTMPAWTPLPPPIGTQPPASFLPVMGGYDAGYYGYVWSRVYAQDLFTAFGSEHLFDPEVGRRYRREILEPGATVEPDVLVRNFLGRPLDTAAFHADLGLAR